MENRLVANIVLFFPFECGATGCWDYTFVFTYPFYSMYHDSTAYLLSDVDVDNVAKAKELGEGFYRSLIILIGVAL